VGKPEFGPARFPGTSRRSYSRPATLASLIPSPLQTSVKEWQEQCEKMRQYSNTHAIRSFLPAM